MKRKITLAMMLVFAILLSIIPINALAATVNEYGLKVDLLTDKQEYEETDTVQLTVNVVNTNAFEVKNITVESILPKGLKLVQGSDATKTISSLKGGQNIQFKINVENNPYISNPTTGERTIIIFILMAAFSILGISVAIIFRKKFVKVLTLLLCITMLTPLMGTIIKVNAESVVKNFTVSEQIKFNGENKAVAVKLSYDFEEKIKLTTPVNVKSDDKSQLLSWDEVEHADGYYVFTTDDLYYTGSNLFSYCNFQEYGFGNARVVAVSKEEKYIASDFSDSVKFKFQSPGLESNILKINDYETENKTTYFGMGYNVITSPYINAESVQSTNWIFDQVKIRDTLMTVDSANSSVQFSKIEGNSLQEFMNKFNKKISGKVDIKTPWAKFTGSFSAQRSGTSEGEVSRQYIKNSIEARKTIINWIIQEDDYDQYLTDKFKNDLMNDAVSPAKLFNKYGTHFIKSGILGGKIDFDYELYSEKQHDLSQFAADLTANVSSSHFEFDAAAEEKTINDAKDKEVIIKTNSTTLGGSSLDMSSLESMNKNYQLWLDSLQENCALIDLKDQNSLCPIWDLLPNEPQYELRKAALMDYFNSFGQENYNELMRKFPSVPTKTPIKKIAFETPQIVCDNRGYDVNSENKFPKFINRACSNVQFGQLLLSNCKSYRDEIYSAIDGTNNIGLFYKVNVDPNSVFGISLGDEIYLNSNLAYDTAKYPIKNFPYFEDKIGYGIYYIKVFFDDNTTKAWVKTNFLENKSQNDTIDLLKDQNLSGHSGIKSIKVRVAYELDVTNTYGKYVSPNIVTEKTINFK